MDPATITLILNSFSALAPALVSAIVKLFHAAGLSPEELRTQAAALDDETIAFLEAELAKLG